ncbi:Ig-like domain-containing protein [Frondihabitans peucedani]|uniref:Ig-like domain-containing protein n=1 Tax=Frondihabitans peucedani TaxID=598626 RepID=UPI0031DE295D
MSTLGAALLAGVTLATMVAPAANAASAPAAPSASEKSDSAFKAVLPAGNGYVAIDAASGRWIEYSTEASARAAAVTFRALPLDGDNIQLQVTEGNLQGSCLVASDYFTSGGASYFIAPLGQCSSSTSHFKLDASGRLSSFTGRYLTTKIDKLRHALFLDWSGNAAKFEGLNAFTGSVSSTSIAGKSADLTGFARPNSDVIINGTALARADSTGTWSFSVNGLSIGDNSIQIENWLDGAKVGEISVIASLKVTALTATASSTPVNDDRVTISGTGEHGAVIVIKNAEGVVVGTSAADAATGRFQTTVNAPNEGGSHTFIAEQSIGGTAAGSVQVSFDYGTALSVTSPADELVVPAGPVTFSGRGTAAGSITIREEGKPGVLAAATVLANGNWVAPSFSVDGSEHTFTVTQLSKGNNTTTAKVTLNPGASNVRDLVVATPVDGGTVPSTGGRITVTGTGQPGSDVSITASNGRLAGTGKVAADGTFSFPAVFNSVFYNATVKQVAPTGQTQSKSIGFTVVASDGVNLPFSVTSPTTNGTVRSTNKMITVTGNGKAGAAVKITAANGRIAGQGVVGADGRYSFPAEFQALPYTATVTMTPAMGAAENITITNFTVVANEGVNLPFRVTAPVTNGTASSTNKMVTFTGEGKAGATIRIIAASNGRMAGQGVVGADGRFSVQAEFAALKYSAYVDMVPTAGAKETITVSDFTVVSTDGVNKPFRVTAPVSNGTAPSVDKMVTFRGEGTAGDTVKIIAASNGRLAGQGVVDQNGDFSVQAEFAALKYTAHVDMVTPSGMKETITVTDFQVTAQ